MPDLTTTLYYPASASILGSDFPPGFPPLSLLYSRDHRWNFAIDISYFSDSEVATDQNSLEIAITPSGPSFPTFSSSFTFAHASGGRRLRHFHFLHLQIKNPVFNSCPSFSTTC